MGKKRRPLRNPRLADGRHRHFNTRSGKLEGKRPRGRARGKRGERIAGRRFVRRLAAEVNETTVVAGMLQRMDERRLPSGKERRDEKKSC